MTTGELLVFVLVIVLVLAAANAGARRRPSSHKIRGCDSMTDNESLTKCPLLRGDEHDCTDAGCWDHAAIVAPCPEDLSLHEAEDDGRRS